MSEDAAGWPESVASSDRDPTLLRLAALIRAGYRAVEGLDRHEGDPRLDAIRDELLAALAEARSA